MIKWLCVRCIRISRSIVPFSSLWIKCHCLMQAPNCDDWVRQYTSNNHQCCSEWKQLFSLSTQKTSTVFSKIFLSLSLSLTLWHSPLLFRMRNATAPTITCCDDCVTLWTSEAQLLRVTIIPFPINRCTRKCVPQIWSSLVRHKLNRCVRHVFLTHHDRNVHLNAISRETCNSTKICTIECRFLLSEGEDRDRHELRGAETVLQHDGPKIARDNWWAESSWLVVGDHVDSTSERFRPSR